MKNVKFFLSMLIVVMFFSCDSDDDAINGNDDSIDNVTTSSLDELRNATTTLLTSSGMSKTWRITEATLSNGSSNISITPNFNVVDDEFIFGGTTANGTLEWRKGFAIKTNATNSQETLLDRYVSNTTTTFSYQDDSSTVIEADFGSCVFEIHNDDTVSATITNTDNTIFNFLLQEKLQSDYASAPSSGLNFTSAFTFESNSIVCCSPGMVGSYSDNSFFVSMRESIEGGNPERVLKFDIATNTLTENSFESFDFVSKQLHIVNNELIVVGGQNVNTYDLNLSGDPVSTPHGKSLSRFGTSVIDSNVYIVGGDLNNVESNQIFKWNLETQVLSEFGTLPESKFGARATIVNDYMYVFGGTEEFASDTPSNNIYKININNPSNIETFQMNKFINYTYVQKFQNLIYVAGRLDILDESSGAIGREFTIGVFDTLDNSYQELTTNLTSTSGLETIHQMTIFNNKMYIIFGDFDSDGEDQFQEWDILATTLD